MHAPNQIRLTFSRDHPEPYEHEDEGAGLAVQKSKPVLQPPSLYKAVLFNDDYILVDFVVEALEVFFNVDREKVTKIMLTVHTQGKVARGLPTQDMAEAKAIQVNQYVRESQHPLLCRTEEDS